MPVVGVGKGSSPSLRIETKLNQNTKALGKSYERLSSGLRINRASDDPAGLSVSSLLSVNKKVFAQGIKNVNDGVSLLNVAQGAVQELGNIVTRIQELAQQSANGSLNRTQRLSIDAEGNALTQEYNRIIGSTDFNSLKLIDPSIQNIGIQIGYGTNGQISFNTANAIERTVGDGTYLANISYVAGTGPSDVALVDINGDGISDLITSGYNDNSLNILIGNSDGSFQAKTSIAVTGITSVTLADVNRDGYLDIIASSASTEDKASVFLGNGNGTFGARTTFAAGDNPEDLEVGDVNGDGFLDIVTATNIDGNVNVLLGNGNGTFRARTSYSVGVSFPTSRSVELADLNGDGRLDIVATARTTGDAISVFLANSDGSFSAPRTFITDTDPYNLSLSDFNFDGILDIAVVANDVDKVDIFLGNGDGTFKAKVSYATNDDPKGVTIADMNGDGLQDLVISTFAGIDLLIGNGDGTFRANTSFATATGATNSVAHDFNRDGSLDIAVSNAANLGILLANGNQVTNLPRLNLTTVTEARTVLTFLESAQQRIQSNLAAIGSSQSRLEVALRVAEASTSNFEIARSRITDVDMAEEAANLVRLQVLQQADVALHAQANQTAQIAINLLKSA